LILTGFLFPAAACAMPLPDCAGAVEVAHAHIVRVEKNGALILSDGRAVLLEGIRLPGADRPGDVIAATALDVLRELAMKEPLTLTSTLPKEDRYDRVRVQAFGNNWLQVELLQRGLARAYIAPDREECSPDFYEAEVEARQARRGLWALPEYAVRKAASFSAPPGSFQVVEGRIVNVATHDGRVFLDFNMDFHKGFSAIIAPDDHKAFRGSDPALEDLAGHEVRLRGIVEEFNGRPEIGLFNPKQVEFLQ
jgi:endonuclease YncB( thermonuclease family)